MGAGKTTVGQLLARRLRVPFVDSDRLLEERTGVSIATIFELEGEARFREREAALIDELLDGTPKVLATGGGAVLSEATRRALRTRAVTVYLHTRPETSYARVRRCRDRPLLRVADPLDRLRTLYSLRDPLYREVASTVVESNEAHPSATAKKIAAWLSSATAASPELERERREASTCVPSTAELRNLAIDS